MLTKKETTSVESQTEEGMGLQLFADGGRSAFVSVDRLNGEALDDLFRQGLSLLRSHPPVRHALNADLYHLQPLVATRFLDGQNVLADMSSDEQLELITDAHLKLYELEDEHTLSMASTFSAVDDEWRIFRSDGTDVHFNVWRTVLAHRITLSEDGKCATVRETQSGKDAAILSDETLFAEFSARVRRKMAMGLGALRGDPLQSGRYNIILDAGMAKGLAHEAFGHACESDRVLDGSALTLGGKYRVGEKLAPDYVSIFDAPIEGDWADQPYSANGFPRKEVAIVRNGHLEMALTDIFSGPAVGLESTGAERAERYDFVPLPRMSNIRLEVEGALSWEKPYGLVEADELFHFLVERGMISDDETWVFLEGYRGGQVNSASGDFVFHCTAAFKFEGGRVTIHPPVIFSGQVLKTLASLRGAVGPLELRRQGMCGKDGQRVPSSGGGHLFTLFGAGDGFVLGGL